jgi:DNA-binding Lrp family transcriptional regulator
MTPCTTTCPLEALALIAIHGERLEKRTLGAIDDATREAISWSDIADALGVTEEEARKRWG